MTVSIGLVGEPDSLFLAFTPQYASALVLAPLYRRPVQHDDSWSPRATYIERIPVPGQRDWLIDGDMMRIVYRFHRGLTWHDGHPLDARDTAWTWSMWTHPQLRSIVTKSDDVKVSSMDCPDPHTLVVTWRQRTPNANIGHRCLPRHLLADAFAADPAGLPGHPFGRAPIGNGPFRFRSWTPGQRIELTRAQPPLPLPGRPVTTLVFRLYSDTAALLAAWQAGDLDLIPLSQSLDETAALEREFPGFSFTYKPALAVERLDFNLDSPALGDVRARRALALAIDRDTIVSQASGGRLHPATSWLPTGHPDHEPVVSWRPDPVRARALLLDCGWEERAGRLVPPGASALDLVTTGEPLRRRIVESLAAAWSAIGVTAAPRYVTAAELFTGVLPRRRFSHLAIYAWSMHLHAMGFGAWHSSQIPTPENGWQGRNYPGWRSEKSDRILTQALAELDAGRRRRWMIDQQKTFADEMPCVPLFMRAETAAHRRSLGGVRPTGLSVAPVTWNAEQWYWRQTDVEE